MPQTMDDPAEFLRRLGQAGDGPCDIATAALMLSALDHAGHDIKPYREHLADIARTAKAEMKIAVCVEDAAQALANVIAGRFGYDGDRVTYADSQNADFMAVLERRRGLPVALGILYIHAARAAEVAAAGLNTPGHFLLQIGFKGREALIDPFNGWAAIDRERLGALPGMGSGPAEDLRLAEPVGDADVLLRLLNNLKFHAVNAGDRGRALEIAKRMVLIAPARAELWIDLARLNEMAGALGAAKKAYEACLSLAKSGDGPHNEAAIGLSGLKRRLN